MGYGTSILAAGAAVVQLAMPPAAVGQCNFEAEADASMFLNIDLVTVNSKHFGQITNVECIHSRKTVLRHKTLKNGYVEREDVVIGGPANFGASIGPLQFGDTACPAISWTATTEFGTRFFGVNFWHAQDLDNYFPSCSGGGGGCARLPDTDTWMIGPTAAPSLAVEQLRFGLERVEKRPESTFYLEEWAVVTFDAGWPSVQQASTEAFGARVGASAHAFAAGDGGRPF